MAITFGKKPTPAPAQQTAKPALKFGSKPAGISGGTSKPPVPAKPGSEKTAKPAQVKKSVSFVKTGAAAKKAMADEEARAEARAAEQGKMFRFWMPDGADRVITFLDGTLDDDGQLEAGNYYEHTIKIAGDTKNFVCTADIDPSQPCPICERGDSRPTLVYTLTVIDHTPHTIQKGPNAGKVVTNSRKLFICKNKTFKILNKAAKSRGGLVGCTFEASRMGEKEPGVGSTFDFQYQWEDWGEFMAHYGIEDDADIQPADYNEEITYHSPEELIELGVGKKFSGIGSKKTNTKIDKKALADQM